MYEGTNAPARVAAFGYDFVAYYNAANRLIATGTPYQPDADLDGPVPGRAARACTSTRRCPRSSSYR